MDKSVRFSVPQDQRRLPTIPRGKQVRTGIAERQVQQDHRLLPDVERLGLGEDLADAVGRSRGEADFRFLEVFDLLGYFKVFREQLRSGASAL